MTDDDVITDTRFRLLQSHQRALPHCKSHQESERLLMTHDDVIVSNVEEWRKAVQTKVCAVLKTWLDTSFEYFTDVSL